MKTVVVCCGSACATSSMLENELKALMQKNHIEGKVMKCRVSEMESVLKAGGIDLIVPSGKYKFDTEVPVISGMAYITGIGKEKVESQILEVLSQC